MAGHTLWHRIAHYNGFCMKHSIIGSKLNLILYIHHTPLIKNAGIINFNFGDIQDMRTSLKVDLSENL